MDTALSARIERDPKNKEARLEITARDAWNVYAGPAPGSIDTAAPVLSGQGSGTFPLPVPRLERSYFVVEGDGGRLLLAETHLPMDGGWNFRDLGGIRTADKKQVAWGRLIRTDDLQNLTVEDQSYLASIPITTIVDFRTQYEVSLGPDVPPASVRFSRHLPVEPGRLYYGEINESPSQDRAQEIMKAVYRELVTTPEIIALYREFFSYVQDENSLPLLFHCSAGKDRTGMAAALILLSLGVEESVIMDDYMLSARYLQGKYPGDSPLFSVHPAYLEAALEQMYGSYGSPLEYLTGHLGVQPEKMRALFLMDE